MTTSSSRFTREDVPSFNHDNIDATVDKLIGNRDTRYARAEDTNVRIEILVKLIGLWAVLPDLRCT
jgi:hypothetical protein